MNKTQINFCRDRIGTIIKQKEREMREEIAYLPELTTEQKIAQIQNGSATLKMEKYSDPNKCPYNMGYVDQMFEWDGETEIIAKNDAMDKKFKAAIDKMNTDGENIIDRFVLGEITEAKAISQFKAKKYSV